MQNVGRRGNWLRPASQEQKGGFTNMAIFSLKCASCSAPLQIKPEVKDFLCAYCGVAQIVDRSGGTISLNLVAETLGRVERGTDKTASELALVRLNKERKNLGDFRLLVAPGTPPRLPEVERPFVKSGFFYWLKRTLRSGSLIGANQNRLDDLSFYFDTITWKEYDEQMITYNQFVADWPALQKKQSVAEAERDKRVRELDAEIAFHQEIVKRG
jgi:DNA-directed RNA polymerase subunit RPC12/RpoP